MVYWWVGNLAKNCYRESQIFELWQARPRTILVKVAPQVKNTQKDHIRVELWYLWRVCIVLIQIKCYTLIQSLTNTLTFACKNVTIVSFKGVQSNFVGIFQSISDFGIWRMFLARCYFWNLLFFFLFVCLFCFLFHFFCFVFVLFFVLFCFVLFFVCLFFVCLFVLEDICKSFCKYG